MADTVRPRLTRRQQEVLELLATGKTDDEIAEQLRISALTVQTHTSAICIAWGIKTREELCRVGADQADAKCSTCTATAEARSLHRLLGEAIGLLNEINAEFPWLAPAGRTSRG